VLDDMGSIFGIEAFGDRLIAGGALDQPIEDTPKGRMVSIMVSTAGVTKLDLTEGVPTVMSGAGPALVYTPGVPRQTPSGDWQFSYTKVVRWDLQTDDRRALPTPDGATSAPVIHLAGNIKGEVFWSSAGRGEPAIAKWDPCTQATTWLTTMPSIGNLMADASAVYWLGWDEDGHGEISSLPSTGGTASVLYRSLDGVPILGGLDDTLLYYGDAEAGIMAMPKEGGTGHVVIEKAVNDILRLDQSHVYWTEPLSEDTIRRAAKSDGRAEVFWSGPGRWVQAMAVDDCNIYWVVANPFEVFYRRK
jgi:hypothetical protein